MQVSFSFGQRMKEHDTLTGETHSTRWRNEIKTKVRLATLVMAVAMIVSGAANTSQAAEEVKLRRFLACSKADKDGVAQLQFEHPSQYFSMLKTHSFLMPIADTSGKNKAPSDPRLVAVASSLAEGDLIKLAYSPDDAITRIEKYLPRPGEDMPDYQEFVRMTRTQFKGQEFPAVVLRRFLEETEYPIGRLDTDKKWQPDSQLAAKARQFVEGAPVEVDLLSEKPGVWSGRFRYFV